MDTQEIVEALNTEIDRLTSARDMLTRNGSAVPSAQPKTVRRILSAAARRRIGVAQRKRWAAKRKQDKAA